MIYINSSLEGVVKDQLHPFIKNNSTSRFANTNAMFTFPTSLYDDSDLRRNTVSVFGNLHQRNKAFFNFMLEFLQLMNDISYKEDQSKIDLLSVKLSNKMNQFLIGQSMPFDFSEYVTRLHKLDTDVRITNQRKNIRVGLRSTTSTQRNFATLGQSFTSSSKVLAPYSSNPFSYYPSISHTTAVTTPFASSLLPKSLPTRIELDACSRLRGPLTDVEKQF